MSKKWYDVTVTESYHSTYKVLAEDEQEANDMVNILVNKGQIDPINDNVDHDSYNRDVSVDLGDKPDEGDEYWVNNGDNVKCELPQITSHQYPCKQVKIVLPKV